jgi:hypothetical protein
MFRHIAKNVFVLVARNILTPPRLEVKMNEEVDEVPYKGTSIGFGCQLKK